MIIEKASAGKQSPSSPRYTSGSAYITIPTEVDREQFIQQCYRMNRVCLLTENNEFFKDVPIDKSAIQNIEFPESGGGIGSPVIWVNIEPYNQVVIVAVLSKNDETFFLNEKKFKLNKTFGSNSVDITGDGGSGNLLISLNSDKEEGGLLNITINNKNKTGQLKIFINGSGEIYCTDSLNIKTTKKLNFEISDISKDDKITTLTYVKGEGFKYKDEYQNSIIAKDGEINITSKKIIHNSGNEPMLLGNTTIQLISDLLDQLAKESAGPYPLLGQAQYTILKQKLDKLKSTKSFLE